MGAGTEKYAASADIDREPQDELAAKSHERAAAAIKDGLFDDEIVPVEIPQRKGDPILFDTDEGVRPGTTVESLGALRPAFDKAGNITAGNASQISDGGAAVIVTSKARGRGARRRAARRDRRLRPGGRARPVAAHPAVAGHQARPSRRRASRSATSTCSSSTRRSPPSAWPRWPTSASPTTRQRQRRRHRPRPPGRHVRHPPRAHAAATSCAAVAAASAPPRCAAAAARATPSCCQWPDPASCPNPTQADTDLSLSEWDLAGRSEAGRGGARRAGRRAARSFSTSWFDGTRARVADHLSRRTLVTTPCLL